MGWGGATDHTPASSSTTTTTPSSSVIKCPPTLTRHALGHTEKVEGGTPQEKMRPRSKSIRRRSRMRSRKRRRRSSSRSGRGTGALETGAEAGVGARVN